MATCENFEPKSRFLYLRKNNMLYPAQRSRVKNNFKEVTNSGWRNQCIPPTTIERVRKRVPIRSKRNAE